MATTMAAASLESSQAVGAGARSLRGAARSVSTRRRRTTRAPDGRAAHPTDRSRVPTVASGTASRGPGDRDIGQVGGRRRVSDTLRCRPACHHWSWSSTQLWADHRTTTRRDGHPPAGPDVRGDVELGGQPAVGADPDEAPVDPDREEGLAAPTRSTTRRPRHSRGTVTVVRCTPVGLGASSTAPGTTGGGPGNGMITFV